MEPTTSKTPKSEAATAAQASGKNPKPAKKAKAKAVKEPKKEKAPREELCVFAFRLRPEERDRIHAASGPGGATRLVRSAAIAIADGNRAALDQLLVDVKANLKS